MFTLPKQLCNREWPSLSKNLTRAQVRTALVERDIVWAACTALLLTSIVATRIVSRTALSLRINSKPLNNGYPGAKMLG